MKKWLLVLLLPALLGACKGTKKQLTDEEVVTAGDFVSLFSDRQLPVQIADSSFHKKGKDSTIAYTVFKRFVPDSVLGNVFGKNAKPIIYVGGKVAIRKQETYLFVKAVTASKKAAFIVVFDKELKFSAAMPLIILDKESAGVQTAVIDNKYTIAINRQKRDAGGSVVYRKTAWVYNSAGVFTLILTESNDMTAVRSVLINPIDTLARSNKLSGDYVRDKMNLVSIRDGKTASEFLFFIHFEKDGGACKGELKGKARILSPTKAIYHQIGDQCELEFNFSGKSVSIREETGCGSHRDIKCFFEGSFIKKAEPKKKASSK
jgi:hypothetical protein